MDRDTALHLLQTLIDYFEAGNKETDHVAKDILAYDFEFQEKWSEEIKRLLSGGDWSGLRAPESEIIAIALHHLQQILSEPNS